MRSLQGVPQISMAHKLKPSVWRLVCALSGGAALKYVMRTSSKESTLYRLRRRPL